MKRVPVHKVERAGLPLSYIAFFRIFLLALTANGSSAQGAAQDACAPGTSWALGQLGATLARDPIFVYNNWSAYDELSAHAFKE